jgi:hypothetical protein
MRERSRVSLKGARLGERPGNHPIERLKMAERSSPLPWIVGAAVGGIEMNFQCFQTFL